MTAGTGVLGVSQEANIGPIVVGSVGTATTANDPLTALSVNPTTSSSVCVSNATGKGGRYRGIGTGEVVEGVLPPITPFAPNVSRVATRLHRTALPTPSSATAM